MAFKRNSMMTRAVIYYVRHAENEANVSGVFSHRAIDLDLTERGRLQASQVAEFLATEPLGDGPIFMSPLRRAVQTAAAIAERLGRDTEVIEQFRELDVGDLEGHSGPQAIEAWSAILDAWHGGQHEVRFSGGENHLELTRRLEEGLRRVLASAAKGPFVVVAHAGLLRIGFNRLTTPAPPRRLSIPNCSVSRFAISSAGTCSFDYFGRCEFLTEPTAGAKH